MKKIPLVIFALIMLSLTNCAKRNPANFEERIIGGWTIQDEFLKNQPTGYFETYTILEDHTLHYYTLGSVHLKMHWHLEKRKLVLDTALQNMVFNNGTTEIVSISKAKEINGFRYEGELLKLKNGLTLD